MKRALARLLFMVAIYSLAAACWLSGTQLTSDVDGDKTVLVPLPKASDPKT